MINIANDLTTFEKAEEFTSSQFIEVIHNVTVKFLR